MAKQKSCTECGEAKDNMRHYAHRIQGTNMAVSPRLYCNECAKSEGNALKLDTDFDMPPLDVALTYHLQGLKQNQEAVCSLKFYTLYKPRSYGSKSVEECTILKRYEDDNTYQFTLKPSEMFTLCIDATPRLADKLGHVLHGGTVYFTDGEVKVLSDYNLNFDIYKRV